MDAGEGVGCEDGGAYEVLCLLVQMVRACRLVTILLTITLRDVMIWRLVSGIVCYD